MAQLAVLLFLTLFSSHVVHSKQSTHDNLDIFRNVFAMDHGIGDIMDYIKHLMKTTQDMIANIIDSLRDLANEFQEKIKDAISNIHISILINQLKRELATIVSKGGEVAQQCAKEADAQILTLTSESNSASQQCKNITYTVLTQFNDEMKQLADKARDMLDQFVVDVTSCVQHNVFNPVTLIKCLQTKGEVFTENINNIQQQIEITIEKAKNNMKESVFELAACMNNVQMETIKSGQKILAQTETCIAGK